MIYIGAAFILVIIISAAAGIGMGFEWLLDRRDPSRQFLAWRVAHVKRLNRRYVVMVRTDTYPWEPLPFSDFKHIKIRLLDPKGYLLPWRANRVARKLNRAHFVEHRINP